MEQVIKKRGFKTPQRLNTEGPSLTEKAFIKGYTDPNSPTVLNASKTYQAVYGCAESTAGSSGFKMLRRPMVKKAIRELLDEKQIEEKIAHNLDRLISAAGEADTGDYRVQKLGLEANNFVKDVMGWKQPDQHLHMNMTPESREQEYLNLINKIREAQGQPLLPEGPVTPKEG